ncbi:reverse transcriptase [Gossypium australe]|uniref:Reverse transcriptase n=1 Tax=Gossypium australe TaxID=47621 RepID=A0A5B6VJG0_9ROSI|nr:reverse transcriptase [Gossypium australe]
MLRKSIGRKEPRIQWLREGDRNTGFFHVQAMSRRKKNSIDRDLGREFTDDEILTAFNQMDSRKAPCIDGLPDSFYREHWQTVGVDILKLCHEALRDTNNIQNVNDTLLVLIPKVDNPCDISKNGPNKRCAVKLDMSKAYDRVEKVLLKFGFSSGWVTKIMNCVRTVNYRVKFNSNITHIIVPERGLRQGDPLSPYLFLFCMDALSRMLMNAQVNSKMKGIRASKEGPCINHLFFDDDALLFVRNNRNDVEECMRILDKFEKMSGVSRFRLVKRRLLPLKSLEQDGLESFVPSQGHGGIGFRDLHLFNVALLGRQVWRLLTCKDTLCYELLSAKYFSNVDIFHPKNIDKPSFTWQSISKAVGLLSEGFGWDVSNGRSIYLWKDSWGIEGLSGSSIKVDRRLVQETYVSELMDEDRAEWNEERVTVLYGDYLKDLICKLPISYAGHADQRVWFHNPYGFYSTKSAYSWLILKQIGFGPHRIFWRLIWKLKTLPKIRIFCWRLGQEILPIYDKIASIRSGFNSSCPRCGKERESHIHSLRDCTLAKAILEHGGLDAKLLNENFTRCIDWLEAAMRTLGKTAMADLITVLWNIWNSRNNRVFQGAKEDARVTWERASCLSHDFRISNLVEKPMLLILSKTSEWKKPEVRVLKINFDVVFQHNQAHFGLVARDNDGFVLGGRMGKVDKVVTAEWGELRAMQESINFARLKGWEKVELETDCANIVNGFNKRNVDLTVMGQCMRDFFSETEEVHDIILKDAIN